MPTTDTATLDHAIEAFEREATADEKAKVAEVSTEVDAVVARARQLEVRTPEEAQAATEFLSQIKQAQTRAERARTALVKPLNDHVRTINQHFKLTTGPLGDADQIVRSRILEFRREEERQRAEEQARLDAERRERERRAEEERRQQEDDARAAREQAARDAAAAAAAAREVERQRQERLSREASELEERLRGLDDTELRRLVRAGDDELAARAAAQELLSRRQAREAKERAAAAQRAEAEARAAEEAARSAPVPVIPAAQVAAPTKLASASGSVSARKVWKFEVVDPGRVPRQYLTIDEKAIRQAVRDGVREIAGVRIFQGDELAVRTR